MRALVTGASGFLGTEVCNALLARGDEVVGLSRDPEKALGTNPRVAWHAWQPQLERPPAEAFDGVDGVVHLVGETTNQRWTDEAKQRIMESRSKSTHNLAQAIESLQDRPGVLVSQSATGFYGDRGEAIVDESSEPGDDFLVDVVRQWEDAAREVEGTGIRLVTLRSGPVLDPRSGMLKELLTPFKLGVGGPLAGGGQYVPWIHRSDWVALVLWALDNPEVKGVVNATAPKPATNRELSKALGRALNRPAVVPVPGFVPGIMFGREFAETVATAGQRAVPRRAQDLGFEFRHAEIDEALRDLL